MTSCKSKHKKDYATIPQQTFTDPLCEFFLLPSSRPKRNKKKSKKMKHSKTVNDSSYFTRDCKILNEVYHHDLAKTPPSRKRTPSIHNNNSDATDNQILCESMKQLCLSPKVRRAYRKIPVHDQKILNRMAKNRSEKIYMNENAWLARKYWENEKYERELLKCEQEDEYKRAIREKQNYENEMAKERLEALSKRDLEHFNRLREELYIKDVQLKERLKHIKLDKAIMQCQRSQHEYRKCEAVLIAQEEQNLDEAIRKQEIYDRLECRLAKADCIRQNYLNAYTKRLKHDNYMEQIMHEENFKETEKFENYKKEELKQQINRKSCGTKRFVEQRQRNFDYLLERAKLSASLRDLVRRSVSPDGLQQFHSIRTKCGSRQQMFFERPTSNLSLQSCVRFG